MSKEIKFIEGGICAASGFRAAGIHCGIRPNKNKNDLALIYSESKTDTVGLFTKNHVKADPVILDIEALKVSSPGAVIVNSGNANACAPNGRENAERMRRAAAEALGLPDTEVIVSSTGVIGQELNISAVENAVPALKEALAASKEASDAAATAIMTTDTVKKEFALETEIGGKTVHIGGISKGSGMIHPNMGTMLCYVTTDCAVERNMLEKAVREACDISFNRISVDGDTSTNDSLIVMANGCAGNEPIISAGADYEDFLFALKTLFIKLARAMAADGEGAKHLLTCTVKGAADVRKAETIAKSVISSTLTKAAIFGCDANWGRVLCAMGYSGETFDVSSVDICFESDAGKIPVCEKGMGLTFDEDEAKKILSEHEVIIDIDLHEGDGEVTCWGCDITYDYIKINGDYRT